MSLIKATGYAKMRVAIASDAWTPIIPPINCNYFGLKNVQVGDVWLRTIAEDAATEDNLPTGSTESVTIPKTDPMTGQYRFWQGLPALYAKSAMSTGMLVITWVV